MHSAPRRKRPARRPHTDMPFVRPASLYPGGTGRPDDRFMRFGQISLQQHDRDPIAGLYITHNCRVFLKHLSGSFPI